MIDKKKSDVFILLGDFVQVLNPGQIFLGVAFKDCPVWGKICKIMTNHPHL